MSVCIGERRVKEMEGREIRREGAQGRGSKRVAAAEVTEQTPTHTAITLVGGDNGDAKEQVSLLLSHPCSFLHPTLLYVFLLANNLYISLAFPLFSFDSLLHKILA